MHPIATEEEVSLVKNMSQAQGFGIKSIARKTQLPYSVVREILNIEYIKNKQSSLTDAQIDEIVLLYENKARIHDIAIRFKRHYYTIKSALISRGVKLRGANRFIIFSKDQQKDIVFRYSGGESIESIKKSFKCSHKPILKILRANNIQIRSCKNGSSHRFYDSVKIPSSSFSSKKTAATKRGLCWEISQKDVNALFESQHGLCAYTGLPMFFSGDPYEYSVMAKENPYAISIDRKDSLKGYTLDNVVLCCRFVNYAKNLFTEKEFKTALLKAAFSIAGSSSLQEFLGQ